MVAPSESYEWVVQCFHQTRGVAGLKLKDVQQLLTIFWVTNLTESVLVGIQLVVIFKEHLAYESNMNEHHFTNHIQFASHTAFAYKLLPQIKWY